MKEKNKIITQSDFGMRFRTKFFLGFIFFLVISTSIIFIIDYKNNNYSNPITNNGKPWKIGYYEGGPYIHYTLYLRAIVNGFIKKGWIDNITIPQYEDNENSSLIWNFLSENTTSDYLEFSKNAYWSANWNDSTREYNKISFLEQTNSENKVDFMLGLGTWAGNDLTKLKHSINTFICSTSDPLLAGIIPSYEDSGLDNIYAVADPYLYKRQIQQFYNIFGFNNLGIIYENSSDGRIYSHIDDILDLSKKNNFNIVEGYAQENFSDEQLAIIEYNRTLANITNFIDALWMGEHAVATPKNMAYLLPILIEKKIPMCSTLGTEIVKAGVLISLVEPIDEIGEYVSKAIMRVIHGKRPRDIDIIYESEIKLIINLKTAELINYTFPQSIINIANEIYYDIDGYNLI